MGATIAPSPTNLTGPVRINGSLTVVGNDPTGRQLAVLVPAGQGIAPVVVTDNTGATVLAAIAASGGVRPGVPHGGAVVTGTVYYLTGAPANGDGADGDLAIRTDGGALTTIYQRRAGAWVGIV